MIIERELSSSAIHSIKYNSENGQLLVRFTSGPKEYQYDNVPLDKVENLLSAPSIGRYFAQNIRQYATKNYL